jgi:hypothetical protein
MNQKRILVMVRIGEVPAKIEAEWNKWYDATHIPNRINKPGWISARRFEVVGGESKGEYKYLSVYDLKNVDALTSEPYLKLRDWEASLPPDRFEAITPKLPRFARGIYEQIYPERGEYQIPNTEVIFAIAHDVPPGKDDEFNAWYHTEHIPAMMNNVPGFVTGRRFKLLETPLSPRVWSTGPPPTSPKYVSLWDLESEKVFQSEEFLKWRDSPWSSWIRSWYSRRFRMIGRRISLHYPKP